jgi:DNA-directed RNA polymerase subunit M/transcription elongation factor TFIIS
MSSKNINYDEEEEYEDEFFEDEEEEYEDDEEKDNVDVEIEEEEEVIEDEEEVEEEIEEENNDDSGIGIEEIMEEKVVITRKREFNIDREKIRKQNNIFKFNNDIELKKEIESFTSSEKNINIFLSNITSKQDKSTMVNIIRFMYYKDLSLKDILSSIKEDTYSFNNLLWDEQREEIKKEVNRLQTKIEVMESYIECPRCKQKKIQFYNVQLRRADEPPTTFNNCMNKDCMYTWRTG